MKKAIVLSSGGVDSTTRISVAVKELGADIHFLLPVL